MTETNQEIRQAAKQANVFHYEIADRLHIQDSAFSRMLRKELPEEKIRTILAIIQDVSKQKAVITNGRYRNRSSGR